MKRHPLGAGCLLAVLALFAAIGLGVLLVAVLLPALKGERPADVEPTPTLVVVVVEPSPRPSLPAPSRTPTMAPPERILLTPVFVPAPTRTPTPGPVPPTDTPTPAETRVPVQRG